MPQAFQLRTLPEIIAQMQATAKRLRDDEVDLNPGSLTSTFIEMTALQDADQYIQIGRLLDLFNIDDLKGDDLDRRALDFGAAYFEDLRRRPAQTSIAEVVAGDGSVQRFAKLTANVSATASTFDVDDASLFATSGAAVLERGTEREEEIIFTRVGNTLTVIFPASGLKNPHVLSGRVETTAIRSTVVGLVPGGATVVTLAAGTGAAWPASGNVIFERETVRRELRAFTRVGDALTLTVGTTYAHSSGTDVTLSTFGSDRTVAAGSQCYVPESATSKRVPYRTTASGTLKDGDYVSALIPVESEQAGAQTLAGSGTITKWATEPFANATVTNPNAAVRGCDREKDDPYRDRLRAFTQSLSRATALAVETLVAGKQDSFSNLSIAFAQAVEPVAPGESLLYVTDGSTTFSIDYQVKTGRVVCISDARVNDKRGRLPDLAPYKMAASPVSERTPRLFKSSYRGSATSTGANYIEDTTQAWTPGALVGMYVKTDENIFYAITANTAIRLTVDAGGDTPSLGSFAVFNFTASPLEPGVDYQFNQSNGDFELTTGLVAHDAVVAADDGAAASVGAYTYSRGLAAYAQRLVNGDRTAFDSFPGIKALGTMVRVVAPTVITQTFVIQVVTESGYSDADLQATVQSVVRTYVNGLGIGQPVLLSEIIRLVKSLAGVRDCKVISPSANVSVPDGTIARINDSDVQVV